jgi:polysaccharide pyruvyl transferase WcaK-like protein
VRRTIVHAHAAEENLGDRLIVDAIRGALRARLPQHELEFIDALPGTAANALALDRPSDPSIQRAIDRADLVVIGGGELVGAYRGYLGLGLVASASGVPTVWLGVGGRIPDGRVDQIHARFALKRAEVIVTRDAASYADLVREVPGVRVHDGVDVAFGWRPELRADRGEAPEFGVCLRGPERSDRPWDRAAFVRLARQIEVLAKRGLRPVFFTFLNERDARRVGSPNLRGSFSSDAAVHDLVRDEIPDVASDLLVAEGNLTRVTQRLQGLRFMLGMRLHALILSAHCAVPFIALDYAPKVVEFADLVGAREWVVRPDEIDSHLPALAARLCDPGERARQATRLVTATAALRERAMAQLELVAPLLEAPRSRRRRPLARATTRAWLRVAELHARL